MDSNELTTLYLVYRYMKDVNPSFDDPAFNLIYETKVAWSLEHIHAQQSEGMRTQEMWK